MNKSKLNLVIGSVLKRSTPLSIAIVLIAMLAMTSISAMANEEPATIEPLVALELDDTARVVDYDDGIYVVGTSSGDLYVVDDCGEYTVTALGAGRINDVRIENGFIAVAAGNTVIELSLAGLEPTELWRTSQDDWHQVVSTDLSEDGDYVAYLAQRTGDYYVNAGEIGVLGEGLVISSLFTSGWKLTNWWLDATGDMKYLAASHPTYQYPGDYYRVGVGLYQFDGSALSQEWWTFAIPKYEVTEVRISENEDYVAAATSSGVFMKLFSMTDGAIIGSYETVDKEQYAVDGDDNLNYVIGGTQYWSTPYPWFVLKNLGDAGYEEIATGEMDGRINDLDSTPDARYLVFGSDNGEVLMLERTGDMVEEVLTLSGLPLIDAIEIGTCSLLVGGEGFIHIYDRCPPEVACLETVNPHGNNIPGGKNDKNTNEDGFYELAATDICDAEPELYLMSIDVETTADLLGAFDISMALGPYTSGYKVKYTEANGAKEISEKKIGSDNGQADAIDSHVKGPHDLVVFAMDDAGNLGVMTCLVPPPPK